jgi:uncharacterized protein (TIGR02246 family)
MQSTQVSDVVLIKELWHEYEASVSANDKELWIALWTEAGIQMSPDAARRTGKEMIQSEMEPFFDLYDTQMSIYPDAIQVLGNQAYSHGLYEFVMTPKEGGDKIEGNGKFLTILQKQIDGSWRIAIDCFNYDAPFD